MPVYAVLLIVAAVLVVPFLVGSFLARSFRMPDHGWKIGVILFALSAGGLLVSPLGPPD